MSVEVGVRVRADLVLGSGLELGSWAELVLGLGLEVRYDSEIHAKQIIHATPIITLKYATVNFNKIYMLQHSFLLNIRSLHLAIYSTYTL